jgi:hypothetical protein
MNKAIACITLALKACFTGIFEKIALINLQLILVIIKKITKSRIGKTNINLSNKGYKRIKGLIVYHT